MSVKLVLVLRSSPHEVCFHYIADGFEREFFHHLDANIGADTANHYTPEERLMFVFAPLAFTNSKAMEGAPEFFCKSLELDDDHVVVCEVIDDFHLFVVFSSHNYSDMYQTRQFECIKELFMSLLGPCWSLLIPSQSRPIHNALRVLLNAMIVELLAMQATEFQHQFNAMEHLNVKKEHKITSVTALESISLKISRRLRGQGGAFRHSLIFAGTKLLSLYSCGSSGELTTRNILLASLLARTLFHHDMREEIHTDEFVTAESAEQSQIGVSETLALPSEEEFYSPSDDTEVPNGHAAASNFPTNSRIHTYSNSIQNSLLSEERELAQEATIAFSSITVSERNDLPAKPESSRASEISSLSDIDSLFTPPDTAFASCLEPVVNEITTNEKYSHRLDYRFVRLLLDATPCDIGVFSVHIVRISRQLVAVFFQESQEMVLSVKMIRAISLARAQRQKQGEHLKALLLLCNEISVRMSELFGSDIRECRELMDYQNRLRTIDATWNASPNSTRMDQQMAMNDALDHLNSCLGDMFAKLFFRFPWPVTQNTTDVVSNCSRNLQDRLKDYIPFLEVKALRNLAPTSFKCSMPGMIHFVWVDRDRDRVVSPTLDPEELAPDIAARIRHRAEYCRELFLQTKHKDIYCKDTYLQYSYRAINRSYKRRMQAANNSVPTDLIEFVGKQSRRIDTHELFVVHLAHVKRDDVKLHLRRMLENFMRQNDDINSSLGLLA